MKTIKSKQAKVFVWILTILVSLLGMRLHAQQDPMYTQYMFNTLSVNPGYAGSFDAISVLGLYRTQWVGLPGAPVTQTFTVHSPVPNKNMGWGLSLVNDAVGPVHQTQIFVDYSYGLQITPMSKLRLGIKAGIGVYQGNLEDLRRDVVADPYVFDFKGKMLPNIGVGLYYHGERGYVGLAVPKLITTALKVNNIELGQAKRHWFFIGGYLIDLSESMVFKPSFLVKAVEGAPLSIDLSGMVYFYEKLGLGVAYRHGAMLSGLINYYITPSFRVGYAYDYTTTPLRNYSNGTHEFMLGYDFYFKERNKIRSPRFF